MAFNLKHLSPFKQEDYSLPQNGGEVKEISTLANFSTNPSENFKGGSIGALGGGFKTHAIALGQAILDSTGTDDRFLSEAEPITDQKINSYRL